MRHILNRSSIFLMLGAVAVALTGCFDLMGDTIEEPTAVTDPGPGTTNNPPTISGNPPPAITVGDNYLFTPTASDPDGDTQTFSIQNLPGWANFDPSTGTMSGVANLGTEGTYPNIQISVSDGNLAASMAQFSVDVTQIALGSATLSWMPPTQNTDGTPLIDLAAYKIYYGTSPGSYSDEIYIDNPGITTYVVDNLVPNTYYFVSTSINSTGIESVFSNVAIKSVN